jgi:predicted nucleic acid-binding protein
VTNYLIDTNVISELIKPLPEPSVVRWFQKTDAEALFSSVITWGEIRLGVDNLAVGKRRAEIEHWLEFGLPEWFGDNLLPVTRSIADRWGRLTAKARRVGITLATADGLIAATALEGDLVLVTRNVRDFGSLEVRLFDPWNA